MGEKTRGPRGGGPLSFKRAGERDEQEEFPKDALEILGEMGLPLLHIPAAYGGHLHSFEQLLAVSYAIGRRDAAVALTGGLQMWSQLIWMAGSASQQHEMSDLLKRKEYLCLAASEAERGADLLANQCRAIWNGNQYNIFGEKWPIGNARNCSGALVLARTQDVTGPRALSWFLLSASNLSGPNCRRLEKVRTVGLRASDLSGLSFDGVMVGPEAVVGEVGAGLELFLKVNQITRPLVASLSIGPGDTAIRLATSFASNRKLYGKMAIDLPTVRQELVGAWIDLLIAEIVGITVFRGAHFNPSAFCVGSLVAKILVPTLVRRAIDGASRVLGARFFLRDYQHGTFQKMSRDQSVVSFFDGSTEVCRHALATQLPFLLEKNSECRDSTLRAQCTLVQAVPEIRYDLLNLRAGQGDGILTNLEMLTSRYTGSHSTFQVLASIVEQLAFELGEIRTTTEMVGKQFNSSGSRTVEMARAASRYAYAYALALCLGFSTFNYVGDLVTKNSSWLWLLASRLLPFTPTNCPKEEELVDQLFDELRMREKQGSLFSSLHTMDKGHG